MTSAFAAAVLNIVAVVAFLIGTSSREGSIANDCDHFGKAYVSGWMLTCEKEKK